MKRSEQDIRFQWDLTKIFPDEAAWEAAMQQAEAAIDGLKNIPGTLGTSKEAFKAGLDAVFAAALVPESREDAVEHMAAIAAPTPYQEVRHGNQL